MTKAVIETDILSEILRGRNAIVLSNMLGYIEQFGRLSVAAVTVMEVVRGYGRIGRTDALDRFLEQLRNYEVLSFDRESAVLAGEIVAALDRAGKPIGAADPMIAATALTRGYRVVTGNTAHFERIEAFGHALACENWRVKAPQRSSDTQNARQSR